MSEFEEIRSFYVTHTDAGKRLDIYLAAYSGFSRTKAHKIIVDGAAKVNGSSAAKPSYSVQPGDHVELFIPKTIEPQFIAEDIPLDIVYEDDRLIVVNKPPQMVVHPGRGNVTGTLASGLLHYCRTISSLGGARRPGIVHRLDKNTSGLLVAALDDKIHEALSRQLAERKMKRVYTVFVWGRPDPHDGTIDAPIGRHPKNRTLHAVLSNGRSAVTHYTTMAQYRFLSKLTVRLETGRTHQIRVHLSHIGRHVFGDPDYGGREERLKGFSPEIRDEARMLLGALHRQALHAGMLEFRHPATGKTLAFEAPLPEDLRKLQEALEKEWNHR